MNDLFYIIIIALTFAVLPLRYKWREKAMRKLAGDFQLNYKLGQRPSWIWSYTRFSLRFEVSLNFIEGSVNGHSVLIFDTLFPLPAGGNPDHHFTTIEIDGVKKKSVYKSFRLGDGYFTSVARLRNILAALK